LTVLTNPALTQYIESAIIQTKLDRIYFADGSESGVSAGMPFVIVCEGQEPINGIIDFVGHGVSYSHPIPELDNFTVGSECPARLTIAAVDTSAEIVIGTDIPLRLFDAEHETLFGRNGDSLIYNLVDSVRAIGNILDIYLSRDILFSDGTRLDAETVIWWLDDLQRRSRSYLTRYFFARLAVSDSQGIEAITGFAIRFRFGHSFPRATYFLSHPDFAVYNRSRKGTGSLVEVFHQKSVAQGKKFIPNRHYRGAPAEFSEITVEHYEQSYLMKFGFEQGSLDAYVGFGFEAELAGTYDAKAMYPDIIVMISGLAGPYFTQGMFATSLYYRFDPSKAHLFFPTGQINEINRWLIRSDPEYDDKRAYPFNFLDGKRLHSNIPVLDSKVTLAYDHPLLFELSRYLADIAAREGTASILETYSFGKQFDIRLAFLPASDNMIPFALFAAVLELNDQNSYLSAEDQLDRPAWPECDMGSRFNDPRNRNNFFSRAEDKMFEDGAFFPLCRPYIYSVSQEHLKGLAFDFYGHPILEKAVKFAGLSHTSSGGR
jgi:hypothetical protein